MKLKTHVEVFTSQKQAEAFFKGCFEMRYILQNARHACSILYEKRKDGKFQVTLTEERA